MLSENDTNKHVEEIMEKMDSKVERFELMMNRMKKCEGEEYPCKIYTYF